MKPQSPWVLKCQRGMGRVEHSLIISFDNEINDLGLYPDLWGLADFPLSLLPSTPVAVELSAAQSHAAETGLWQDVLKSDIRYPWREGIICYCHLFQIPRSSSLCVPCCPGTYSIAQASLKFTEIFLLQPPEDLNEWTELPCLFKWVLSSCGLVCLWSSKRKQ